MDYTQLIDEAGRYVSQFMNTHKEKKLVYHNLDHTQSVVANVIQIANHYQLADDDFTTVVIAAWFHDIGYFTGAGTGHEARGADMAIAFLQEKQPDATIGDGVRKCIMATVMPQSPNGILEEIVCDADLFHFGTDSFSDNNKALHKEIEATYNKEISKDDWRKGTIALMEQHHYHTEYCRLLLNDKKQENIDKLKAKQAEKQEAAAEVTTTGEKPEKESKEEKKVKKDKANTPGRGIETMFRITSGNNQRLSDMADNKAHILITVNSIILSAIISLVLRKLDESNFLTYPTFVLLGVSVITIVVAILATRPTIPPGTFTQQDIDNKKVNLLFFGNFYRMKLEDYSTGMRKVMADSEFLYDTLIKDVYSQGVVLGRKYRLLRLAYSIFMFGLIISVLGYAAVFVLFR